jgi:hypothetical protein
LQAQQSLNLFILKNLKNTFWHRSSTKFDSGFRYHNLMGTETISVLELMTGGIKAVVTHTTMADRQLHF